MSITEYIFSAFRCLSASKMRTFLTTLGIIVGISSVILINTIGGTVGSTIASTMNSQMKGNVVEILLVDKDADTEGISALLSLEIPDDAEFKRDWIEDYEDLMGDRLMDYKETYISSVSMETADNHHAAIDISAVSPSVMKSYLLNLTEGRLINEDDYDKAMNSVVISTKTAEKLFGSENAIGKQVTVDSTGTAVDGREFTVVGLYKYDDSTDIMYGTDTDAEDFPINVYCSYSYFTGITGTYSEEDNPWYLLYYTRDDVDLDEMKLETEEFFAQYLEDTDFKLFFYSTTDSLDMINSVVDTVTKIIAAIAAISLLVGGIGVMNIMLVSVSERTMEIGVRKAMGADNKSIRIQFLVESVILSLIGSVIGIAAGLIEAKLLALIITNLSDTVSVDLSVPVSAVIGSVVFSFAVGLVFGVYPADKAAKMEVVDALRYE